jgi:hypothetical protein
MLVEMESGTSVWQIPCRKCGGMNMFLWNWGTKWFSSAVKRSCFQRNFQIRLLPPGHPFLNSFIAISEATRGETKWSRELGFPNTSPTLAMKRAYKPNVRRRPRRTAKPCKVAPLSLIRVHLTILFHFSSTFGHSEQHKYWIVAVKFFCWLKIYYLFDFLFWSICICVKYSRILTGVY